MSDEKKYESGPERKRPSQVKTILVILIFIVVFAVVCMLSIGSSEGATLVSELCQL